MRIRKCKECGKELQVFNKHQNDEEFICRRCRHQRRIMERHGKDINWMDTRDRIAEMLQKTTEEVCLQAGCTEEDHLCDVYAYFSPEWNTDGLIKNAILLDVCCPDYFLGHSGEVVAVPLPFVGTGRQLEEAIVENADCG